MKILIYEHACGGGFAEMAVSPGILAEGFGMLRLCAENLKAAGHEVLVIVDEGLARLNPPLSAEIIPVFSFQDAQHAILKRCADIDAAYVIAPETNKTLYALVQFIEQNGVPTLNSYSKAIQAVSNKIDLYKTLNSNTKVKTPKTIQVNTSQNVEEVIRREYSFPVVIKPVDGVGCGGLSVIEEASQIRGAVEKIVNEFASETFIVQEYIEGEAVSVSLLCTDTKILPISLNKQNLTLATPDRTSNYNGGAVPFNHKMLQKAFKTAEATVNCFLGLKGYVGVDLILTDTDPVVVDVNPRLTTSFIGLCRVTDFNFADAIVNAALKNSLFSEAVFLDCYVCFSKMETPKVDIDFLDILYGIPDIVSPPFPIYDSKEGCALIAAYGKSLEEAQCLLEETRRHLLNIMQG
ncbi:MAG: ATP-grasp domain-containing protein [Nitrososphaerota archaeon]|uniref:ATP-grasp domain-containing protein n=1 Tax=Candidatus Bathycorpusculum sp. TaxID=2994959 RepID=UPI00282FFC09|nr:ATP-grasp domain-containing protein [Candidatus Termiticorpusculum sp.]MCL2257100.1 ATP-grasp domain-containing protein [Candidatus Termiticorpusculum sp.]MCL2292755.1 ATP-grasp domain-containing protein [Candidatus Termiticorpusculum sp.]MDR0460645.1 ATP-grasp domain-containing protein [Nitrososphaerota archaeon]